MPSIEGLEVLFVSGFGPIVDAPPKSHAFWRDTLGLPLEAMPNDPDYLHGEKIDGVRHFGLWPLASAAQSCFGTPTWPSDVPCPKSWLEVDVADLASATAVLKARGYALFVENRQEPWGQTVARLQSEEGSIIGISFAPGLHD